MKRSRNNFINSVLRDLKNTSKYLTEDYIFNEEGPAAYPDEEGGGYSDEEYGDEMGGQMPYHEHPQQGDENAEQKAMHVHEVIQHEPIIQKIRQTAIDGLKKYAEDPTSPIYEFFKKVFLESDKVLTDDGSSSNGK